ncbi:MAG: hypothetical protein AAGJ40_06950 [Planctomycetota bacterium]
MPRDRSHGCPETEDLLETLTQSLLICRGKHHCSGFPSGRWFGAEAGEPTRIHRSPICSTSFGERPSLGPGRVLASRAGLSHLLPLLLSHYQQLFLL